MIHIVFNQSEVDLIKQVIGLDELFYLKLRSAVTYELDVVHRERHLADAKAILALWHERRRAYLERPG